MKKDKQNAKAPKFACEKAEFGEACRQGPDKKGRCRNDFACGPEKKGERWFCTRSREQGGPCDEGPSPKGICQHPIPPCTPIRTPEGKKRRIIAVTFSITLLFFTWVLVHAKWPTSFSPGPLSSAHTTISNCATCHTHADESPLKTTYLLLASDDNTKTAITCLTCHKMGEDPFAPHSLPPSALLKITEKNDRDKITQKNNPTFLPCQTCHREHQGLNAPLTKMNPTMCQSCHQQPFHQFHLDHPPFKNYPSDADLTLLFTHEKHFNQYYKEDKYKQFAHTQCRSCHQLKKSDEVMGLTAFEKGCAGCHSQDISGENRAASKGIRFLTVPGLDLETLKKQGFNVGQWPVESESEITPFMAFLFSRNPTLKAVWPEINTLDLMDLTAATTAQLAAVTQFAWTYKKWLASLQAKGGDVFANTLQREKVAETLTPPLMDEATLDKWINFTFPQLNKEMTHYDKNKIPETKPIHLPFAPGMKTTSPEKWANQGGWFIDDDTLYYRPKHHLDPWLLKWIEIAHFASTHPHQKALLTLFKDPNTPGACGKCHVMTDNKNRVWKSARKTDFIHPFTTFNHKPHMPLMGEKGCGLCHQLKASKKNRKADFASINIKTCQSCHQPEKTKSDCTLCHGYHVGNFKKIELHSPIRDDRVSRQ